MTASKEKIAGILGGMGPEATVDLMQRIIRLIPAKDDADHLRCIIDNNPKVPSRIKAILDGNGENPGPCMADMGRRLEAWGADFLAIACNTAHYYHKDVQDAVTIPVLHMIDLTVERVIKSKPGIKKVGIMATPMVRMTKMYEDRFAAKGVEALFPEADAEEVVFSVIRGVKGGGDSSPAQRERLIGVRQGLLARGAECCVLACTELGVVLEENEVTFDAAETLALAIVAAARQE